MKIALKNRGRETPKDIIKLCNGNIFLARILFNRGIDTIKKARAILKPEEYIPYNPMNFPNIKEAINIIKEAISKEEKITIYGDYDADGVTSTSVFVDGLKNVGAKVSYHVPDRFLEGYGMNKEVIKDLSKSGTKLIITCDCGISNIEEVELAKSFGMRVIVTDHHNIGEKLPDADVLINPKLLEKDSPIYNISGCGVAYLVIQALYTALGKSDYEKYLDLVALSVISDVVPIREENRFFLCKGLDKIVNGDRYGFMAINQVSECNIQNEEDITFQISPRINAAGRMDNASIAVEMFLSGNFEEAYENAQYINNLNIDRKNIQAQIEESAIGIIEAEKKNKKILVAYGEAWHHGIIGIVAGRICERYNKPTIVLTLSEDGDTVVGSARSTENINIYEVLTKNAEYLTKFGGHFGAAGLSLKEENLKNFIKQIEEYADIYFVEDELDEIEVDYKLEISNITEELLEEIKVLAPFGQEFEAPIFCSGKLKVLNDLVKKNNHHFLTLENDAGNRINAVIWRGEAESLEGERLNFAYTIEKNQYNGSNEVRLKILNFTKEDILEKAEVQYIDAFHEDIEKILKKYGDAEIFYEGPKKFSPKLSYKNEENISRTDTIILYSVPSSIRKLKRVIDKTGAIKIIRNYKYVPSFLEQDFIKITLGLIKGFINKEEKVSIDELARLLNVDRLFLIEYLKYIKNEGFIDFVITGGRLRFTNGSEKKAEDKALEKTIKKYLAEKKAYIDYMLSTQNNI